MIYKNVSDQEVTIPGKGIIKPGGEVEMPADFNNANFKLVEKKYSPNNNKKVGGEESN